MSEIKHMSKVSPSPELCPECIRLLSSKLKEPVLLHQSFFSLHRSSQSCSLCRLMLSALTGVLTVKNGPPSRCKFAAIIDPKPGQSTQVWARRHMVDYKSFGMSLSENYPISFIEVMLVKTGLAEHLAERLGTSRAPEPTNLNNACWGLNCEPDVVREAGLCPYIWEYGKLVRKSCRLINYMAADGKSTDSFRDMFNGNRPRDVWSLTPEAGVHGPYHRAVIEVSPLEHSPGRAASPPHSDIDNQRDSGVSEIVRRLEEEKVPTSCESPARLDLARRWREDCLTSHRSCESWRESHLFPSRVIDVGPPDGSQEPFLHLPAPSDLGLYICLSHRWGGSKVLQTVMGDPPGTPNGSAGTFSQFQSAIPMETMPKTFRDAIQVTRALGFRYIWIDSLCIVQDRPSDWEAEAEKMGSYYRNAHLTLVAGSAVSADSGLFYPITRPAVPCHIGSVSLELQDYRCNVHGAEPHTFSLFAREPQMNPGYYRSSAKPTCSLDERAWVLQEEVLSARALFFTDRGLYWECVDLSASESHPHGWEYQYTRSLSPEHQGSYGNELFSPPNNETYTQCFKTFLLVDPESYVPASSESNPLRRLIMLLTKDEIRSGIADLPQIFSSEGIPTSGHHRPRSKKRQQILDFEEEHANLTAPIPRLSPSQLARASPSHQTLNDACALWHSLVTEYSKRHLTRETDRLIAIQGLASMLGEVRKDRYYAGLWGGTLREDMLWQAWDNEICLQHMCDCMPMDSAPFLDPKPRRHLDKSESWQAVAPSWSWASADQAVAFITPEDTAYTLAWFFRPLGVTLNDDTAAFNLQGRLKLEGVLRPIRLGALCDEFPHKKLCGSLYDPSDPYKQEIASWYPDRKTSKSGVMVCIPLIMLPLALHDGIRTGEDKAAIGCLLLEPTENCLFRNKASKLLEFRRIGWANFDTKYREFLGLGVSKRMKDDRPWDVRVKEWTRKPVVIDII